MIGRTAPEVWLPLPPDILPASDALTPSLAPCEIADSRVIREREEEQFRHILRSARCLLWSAVVRETEEPNLQWEFLHLDEAAAQKFLPLPLTNGKTYSTVAYERRHPGDRATCDKRANESVRKGESYSQEYRCRGADDAWHWLEESLHVEPCGSKRWRVVGVVTDVTERKRAEALLKMERDFSSAILNTVSCLIAVIDREGRIVRFNRACEQITGYLFEEVKNRRVVDFLLADDEAKGVKAVFEEVCAGQFPNYHENHWLAKNGSRHLIAWSNTALLDPEGIAEYFIATGIDITDRTRLENEQRRSEQELRLLHRGMDEISSGVLISDACLPDNPVIYVNRAFEKITGYPLDEVLGRNCRFLQGADREQDGIDVLKEAIAEGKECHVVLRNYRKDGTLFWNEFSMAPVRDANDVVTHYVGVQKDVTERKKAEEAQQAYSDALEDSDALLWTIIDAEPECVSILAEDGTILVMNAAGLMMLEANGLDEVIGLPFFPFIAPEHRAGFQQMHERVCRGEKADMTFKVISPKGKERWVETRAVPLLYGKRASSAISHLAVTRDITHRRRLEKQVVQSEKMAALGKLVAGVAHEINNPLAAISAHAQLLALHPDTTVQDDAKTIQKMIERVNRIVRSLRGFAIPSGESRKLSNLNDTVNSAMDVIGSSLRGADVQVTKSLAESLPPLLINSGEIEQVIVNLLSNAEHALRGNLADDRQVRIATTVGMENGAQGQVRAWCVLTISDNGRGMPEAVRNHIFDPFFTTKDTGEGTGLGLYISYGIIAAHGGTILVDSQEGEGTTFTIGLPVAAQ